MVLLMLCVTVFLFERRSFDGLESFLEANIQDGRLLSTKSGTMQNSEHFSPCTPWPSQTAKKCSAGFFIKFGAKIKLS